MLLNPNESCASATSFQVAHEADVAKTEDGLFNTLSVFSLDEELNETGEEKEETEVPDITGENDVIEIDWQDETGSVWECPRASIKKDRERPEEFNAGEDEFQCYNNN